MKQEILSLIEDFNEEYKNWDGDIIDLSDEHERFALLRVVAELTQAGWTTTCLSAITGIQFHRSSSLDLLYRQRH